MNRLLVVAGLVGLLCSTAFALVGPPTAELKTGQWSIGYNYTYSTQDLDKSKVKWSYFEDGVLDDFGTDKVEIKDVKIQRHYATISYGIADWWEIYASLGVADTKADLKADPKGGYWDGDQGFNFDNDFAWGWGTKITFARQDTVAWGVAVQMNFLDTNWSEKGGYTEETYTESWKEKVNVEAWDLLVAVGPTIDMGGWKLYGGPFYYYLNGDIDAKETGVYDDDGETGDWLAEASGDLRADSHFGGYVGAQFSLADNCDMTTEFSLTGDGWGMGAGIAWKF